MKQQKGEFICLLTTFLYGGFLALNSLWNSFEVCPHKIHCLVDIYWNLQTRFEIYNWGHLALLRNIFSLYKYTTQPLFWYALEYCLNSISSFQVLVIFNFMICTPLMSTILPLSLFVFFDIGCIIQRSFHFDFMFQRVFYVGMQFHNLS